MYHKVCVAVHNCSEAWLGGALNCTHALFLPQFPSGFSTSYGSSRSQRLFSVLIGFSSVGTVECRRTRPACILCGLPTMATRNGLHAVRCFFRRHAMAPSTGILWVLPHKVWVPNSTGSRQSRLDLKNPIASTTCIPVCLLPFICGNK